LFAMALLDYLVLVAPGSANKKTPAQAHGVEKLFRAKTSSHTCAGSHFCEPSSAQTNSKISL